MVNVAEFKSHVSHYLKVVQEGEAVTICLRNKPIAQLQAISPPAPPNRTQLGCMAGSVTIHGDLTAPAMESDDWDMISS